MSDVGGMVSIEIDGSEHEVARFVSSRRYFALGGTLGGVKSLICHPARMIHASIPADGRRRLGLSDALGRLSPAVEDPDDLVDDRIEGLAALDREGAAFLTA